MAAVDFAAYPRQLQSRLRAMSAEELAAWLVRGRFKNSARRERRRRMREARRPSARARSPPTTRAERALPRRRDAATQCDAAPAGGAVARPRAADRRIADPGGGGLELRRGDAEARIARRLSGEHFEAPARSPPSFLLPSCAALPRGLRRVVELRRALEPIAAPCEALLVRQIAARRAEIALLELDVMELANRANELARPDADPRAAAAMRTPSARRTRVVRARAQQHIEALRADIEELSLRLAELADEHAAMEQRSGVRSVADFVGRLGTACGSREFVEGVRRLREDEARLRDMAMNEHERAELTERRRLFRRELSRLMASEVEGQDAHEELAPARAALDRKRSELVALVASFFESMDAYVQKCRAADELDVSIERAIRDEEARLASARRPRGPRGD